MKQVVNELVKIAKSLTATGMDDIRASYADLERKALDTLAKRECMIFAKEVSDAVMRNRASAVAAVLYHEKTQRTAMVMEGVNYFAQSELVAPDWSLRLFFSQDDWTCYAVMMQHGKRLDAVTGVFPKVIGEIVARRADELGLN